MRARKIAICLRDTGKGAICATISILSATSVKIRFGRSDKKPRKRVTGLAMGR